MSEKEWREFTDWARASLKLCRSWAKDEKGRSYYQGMADAYEDVVGMIDAFDEEAAK